MPWQVKNDEYRLLDGEVLALATLSEADALFLRWIDARAAAGENYESLLPALLGPGGYLAGTDVRGDARPDPKKRRSPLYRAAIDLLARAAERDGLELPKAVRDGTRGGVYSVTEVARQLTISRAAVVRAIQEGRLHAFRMG